MTVEWHERKQSELSFVARHTGLLRRLSVVEILQGRRRWHTMELSEVMTKCKVRSGLNDTQALARSVILPSHVCVPACPTRLHFQKYPTFPVSTQRRGIRLIRVLIDLQIDLCVQI